MKVSVGLRAMAAEVEGLEMEVAEVRECCDKAGVGWSLTDSPMRLVRRVCEALVEERKRADWKGSTGDAMGLDGLSPGLAVAMMAPFDQTKFAAAMQKAVPDEVKRPGHVELVTGPVDRQVDRQVEQVDGLTAEEVALVRALLRTQLRGRL